jgi:HemY protein
VKRLFSFVLKSLIFIGLAVWLAESPGLAHITWHGYEIETSAAFLAVLVVVAGYLLYLLFRLWHLIAHGAKVRRLNRMLKELRQGHENLSEGLIAVAAGDAAEAGRLAVAARKKLGITASTRLLQAQAAQLAGDHAAARVLFEELAAETSSAVLGYRGLIMSAVREKDLAAAGRLAEELRRVKSKTPWLNLIAFELAARRREWSAAEEFLTPLIASRLLEPKRARHFEAVIAAARAEEDVHASNKEGALEAAERAARFAPNWLPAIIMLAERQIASGHRRAGRRTIERSWKTMPHPQLAAALRAGRDTDPLEAYKDTEHLCRDNAEAPESRAVLAEAALEADIWGEARRHLLSLVGTGAATQGAYRLLARLEKRESGNEDAAAKWLAKAIDAPPDPVWLCHACGGAHQKWQVLCAHCGAFDTLEWQVPGQSRAEEAPTGLLASSWVG